jgi:sulfur-oxidizing protein SoxX
MLAPLLALLGCATAGDALVDYRIERDAIPQPLHPAPPDPARGREIVVGRDGNCLLCHALPETGARFMGNLAPPVNCGCGWSIRCA